MRAYDKMEHIGYLVRSRHVRCSDCEAQHNDAQSEVVHLYAVNVDRYYQDCHECGVILHIGASPIWPTLFSRADCRSCGNELGLERIRARLAENKLGATPR